MRLSFAFAAAVFAAATGAVTFAGDDSQRTPDKKNDLRIHLGPRPFYLVEGMDAGSLKQKLSQCKDDKIHRTDFSIGHRGAGAVRAGARERPAGGGRRSR